MAAWEAQAGDLMIYTLAAILIVAFLLGLISDVMIGGFIYLRVLAALILMVAQLIHGRKSHGKNLKS